MATADVWIIRIAHLAASVRTSTSRYRARPTVGSTKSAMINA